MIEWNVMEYDWMGYNDRVKRNGWGAVEWDGMRSLSPISSTTSYSAP